jgi:hypothetical protein
MSLKSSILRRPAGVSPMLMSMKTIGRVEDMVVCEQERRVHVLTFVPFYRSTTFNFKKLYMRELSSFMLCCAFNDCLLDGWKEICLTRVGRD